MLPVATVEAVDVDAALAWAHPLVKEWFLAKFGSATEPQVEGWPAILRGETTLISAPTGSGKTLAAFLVAIDQLLRQAIAGGLAPVTQVVYVSPLKALSNDVQKNLDGPLAEIQQLAAARGYLCPPIRTGVRTGDTLPSERARMLRNPPHILVTTPESLYLLLTAAKSRENLRHVRCVIVDEIHAVADDKRGAHLALSLERLDAQGPTRRAGARRRSASGSLRRRTRLSWWRTFSPGRTQRAGRPPSFKSAGGARWILRSRFHPATSWVR